MSIDWSRRQLLGFSGLCALAGCLDTGGSTGSPNETETGSPDGETPNEDGDTDDETIHEDYETTPVRVVTSDGTELGSVTAAIADTEAKTSLGLSDTDSLPSDRGMLFVFDSVDDHTFYMPDMDFGIDIVYADEDGTITRIHHAPEPGPDEDGADQTYPGRGQYVLEVVYEWTTDHDVSEGDVLEFDLDE